MKRSVFIIFAILITGLSHNVLASSPLKPGDYSWISQIRQEHPRIFIVKDDIPMIKEAAKTHAKRTYDAMKHRADTLLGRPIEFVDVLAKLGDGNDNKNYGFYASDAAMMWLITEDPKYFDLAKEIITKLADYYQLRADNNLNIEWYAFSQICALCAYDWIYNDLTTEERDTIGRALFKAMCDTAWLGKGYREKRFRENVSGHISGLYGTPVLPLYIGLTFWNEGIDNERCESLLRNGYDMHQKMVEFRSSMIGEKGGAANAIPGYSLAAYPYAEYDLIYTFRSAVGKDLTDDFKYMVGYLRYIDWLRIPGNRDFGFGDAFHRDNLLPERAINAHIQEIVNLFGDKHPEILPIAS